MRQLRVGKVLVSIVLAGAGLGQGAEIDIRSAPYNARCDGGDESAVLRAALNALSSGDTLVLPCMMGIGASVQLANKNGVTVRGVNGGGIRVLRAGTLGNGVTGGILIEVRNCSNCAIRDLRIDGNNLCTAPLGATNNIGTTFENLDIRNVSMQCGLAGPATAVIQASGNRRGVYRRIMIDRDSSSLPAPSERYMRGLWLGNQWPDALEWDATVEGNTVRKAGHSGIVLHSAGSTRILNNLVQNAGCAGIKVTADGYSSPSGSTAIQGNILQGNDCHGLQVNVSRRARNMTVQGNLMEGNTQTGIYVVNEEVNGEVLTSSVISANTIRDNRSAHLTGGLYFVHGASGVTVTGNAFTNGTGVQLAGIVAGNDAAITDSSIAGNIFESQARDGITLWAAPYRFSNLRVLNNLFRRNGSNGVAGAGSAAYGGVSGFGNTFVGTGSPTTSNLAHLQAWSPTQQPSYPPIPVAPALPNLSSANPNLQPTVVNTPTSPAPGTPVSSATSPDLTVIPSGTPLVVRRSLGRSVRSDHTGWVGLRLVVGGLPIKVTELGRYVLPGNSRSHQLKLVDAATSRDLAAVTVSLAGRPTGQFAYANLPVPVTLAAGRSYYLLTEEASAGDAFYDFDGMVLTPSSAAAVTNAVYWNGVGYHNTGIWGTAYGPLDLKYLSNPTN